MDKSGKFQDEWGRGKARERYGKASGGSIYDSANELLTEGAKMPKAPMGGARAAKADRVNPHEIEAPSGYSKTKPKGTTDPDSYNYRKGGRLDKRARGGAVTDKKTPYTPGDIPEPRDPVGPPGETDADFADMERENAAVTRKPKKDDK